MSSSIGTHAPRKKIIKPQIFAKKVFAVAKIRTSTQVNVWTDVRLQLTLKNPALMTLLFNVKHCFTLFFIPTLPGLHYLTQRDNELLLVSSIVHKTNEIRMFNSNRLWLGGTVHRTQLIPRTCIQLKLLKS